jgi:hypothetical protein
MVISYVVLNNIELSLLNRDIIFTVICLVFFFVICFRYLFYGCGIGYMSMTMKGIFWFISYLIV